jgi:hypothetical protein
MRNLPIAILGLLTMQAGCTNSTTPTPSPNPVPRNTGTVSTAAAEPKHQLQQGELEARQLAGILEIQAWTFSYSGGRVRCWLEIEEKGQSTFQYGKRVHDVQDTNKGDERARRGKILFIIDRRGQRMALGIESGVSQRLETWSLNEKSLWFGWKSSAGEISSDFANSAHKSEAENPGTDKEVTLLKYRWVEYKPSAEDAKAQAVADDSREVIITLKAVFRVGE